MYVLLPTKALKTIAKQEMIVALDVDNVIIDLATSWLNLYNRDFDDDLTKCEILSYNIVDFVKATKEQMWSYLRSGEAYTLAKPEDHANEAVEFLRKFARVIFVTVEDFKDVKKNWLFDWGFLVRDEDYVVAADKSLINSQLLIDDKIGNLINHHNGYLFVQPWNQYEMWRRRIHGWKDFLKANNAT